MCNVDEQHVCRPCVEICCGTSAEKVLKRDCGSAETFCRKVSRNCFKMLTNWKRLDLSRRDITRQADEKGTGNPPASIAVLEDMNHTDNNTWIF